MILPAIKPYRSSGRLQGKGFKYCSIFALKLDHMLNSNVSMLAYQDEYFASLYQNHVELLQCFTWREDIRYSLELRYISEPCVQNFPTGKVAIAMVLRTWADSEMKAVSNSARLFLDYWPLLTSFANEYSIVAVQEEKLLMKLLYPFIPEDQICVFEIRKKSEDMLLSESINQQRTGFQLSGYSANLPEARIRKNNGVYCVYPLVPRLSDMTKVLERMMRNSGKILYRVILQPLRENKREMEYVESQLMHCERHVDRIGLDGKYSAAPSSILSLRAEALRNHFHRQTTLLKADCFFIRARIFSEKGTSSGFPESLAHDLLEKNCNEDETQGMRLCGGFHIARGDARCIQDSDFENPEEGCNECDSELSSVRRRMLHIVSPSEAAGLFRLPFPSPDIHYGIPIKYCRTQPVDSRIGTEGICIGMNHYKGSTRPIFIKGEDRRRHTYVIGQNGTGKTTLFEAMVLADCKNGDGVGVLDPHGDLITKLLLKIPENRLDDVILFDPADTAYPFGINILHCENADQRYMLVQEVLAILESLFPKMYMGPIFQHTIRNFLLTLMSNPNDPGTLAHIPLLFTNPDYHRRWLPYIDDMLVKDFWMNEWKKMTDFHKSEMCGYIISKFNGFISDVVMRNIIGQPKNMLDFRKIMDSRKILLVNLCKGRLGEINSSLLGMLCVAKIQMAALSRADVPISERSNFFLYVDEFQNIATKNFATILSEARKYGLSLTVTNQFIHQLKQHVINAIFGNMGSVIMFRLGVNDADILGNIVSPDFSRHDLMNLPNFEAYAKIMVDGLQTRPLSICTVKDSMPEKPEQYERIRALSRKKYGNTRDNVEKIINKSLLRNGENVENE